MRQPKSPAVTSHRPSGENTADSAGSARDRTSPRVSSWYRRRDSPSYARNPADSGVNRTSRPGTVRTRRLLGHSQIRVGDSNPQAASHRPSGENDNSISDADTPSGSGPV